MTVQDTYDVVVVGGGPAGATAASTLTRQGLKVLLLERNNRIKPCGGAVPPRLLEEFDVPASLLKAHIKKARIVSPTRRFVDMPIDDGYVGMVDREEFDEWLRERAEGEGAARATATFQRLRRLGDGMTEVVYERGDRSDPEVCWVTAKVVIGADGANSTVASQGIYNASRMSLVAARDEVRRFVPGTDPMPHVAAYHEIVKTPEGLDGYDGRRCEVFYDSRLSPDFYAWVFPHGDTISVGVGSAQRGFSLRRSVDELRRIAGLESAETVRREGAPIPLHPLRRFDNQQNVVLAGDAAGVVAPASGEGIYYAMISGRLAGDAAAEAVRSGNAKKLAQARRRFMREHGQVFRMLGMMQKYWYINDDRRERFVSICEDEDVQHLTWKAYMDKRLVRAKPIAHARIFFKNIRHLTGFTAAPATGAAHPSSA